MPRAAMRSISSSAEEYSDTLVSLLFISMGSCLWLGSRSSLSTSVHCHPSSMMSRRGLMPPFCRLLNPSTSPAVHD